MVLYLGLSRAPDPDGRIFIISEFIEGGNLRGYIFDKTKPLPWRLRLSFATDIARALAYLHARKCIHRDLKGENLLVTANGRLKITDFGFARIAARNEEESKRLTFCGTDSYMSPEILLGHEFDLPTDIFSLGIILCEIAARKLASDTVFKRYPPGFGIDEAELRKLASTDCPQGFISLCLDCLNVDPSKRPTTRQILDRLRDIEAEVISRSNDDVHVGTIKFVSGSKRPGGAPRIPSFGEGVGKDIRHTQPDPNSSDESEDEDYDDAVQTLKRMDFDSTLSTTGQLAHASQVESWQFIFLPTGHSASESIQPLLNTPSTIPSDYSTSVVKKHPQSSSPTAPSLSSILTIRPAQNLNASDDFSARPLATGAHCPTPTESLMSIESYHTASSLSTAPPSIAAATEGGSSRRAMSLIATSHRFTLIKLGAKRVASGDGIRSRDVSPQRHQPEGLWNHLDFLFNINRGAKCDLCTKKLGWKESVECDDCGLRYDYLDHFNIHIDH